MPFKRTLRRSIIRIKAPATEPPACAYYYRWRMDRLVLVQKPRFASDMRRIWRYVLVVSKDYPSPVYRGPPQHHTRWARRPIKK